MKGKKLGFEEIVTLKNETIIWIDYKNGHPYWSGLAIKKDNDLIIKEHEGFAHKINKPTIDSLVVYEWIKDIKDPKQYYLDEILKMIREGNIRENIVLISPSQTATGTIDMFGNMSLNKLKEFEPFEIYKEKEYITFDEAVTTGKNFKYRTWGSFMPLTNVILEIRDIDEDRLEEMFNEKAWEVEN